MVRIGLFLAAMLGTITPFCSCSSIPLFVGFVGAGIPLGVTFAFLIASPLVNEASLFIFPSIFGLKMTFLYNGLGILVSVLAGMAIQKLKLEKSVNPVFCNTKPGKTRSKKMAAAKCRWPKNRYLAAGRAAYHQRDFSIRGFWRGYRRVNPWIYSQGICGE